MFADRFTFLAQVANFLILAWLLRRFLFRPILKAANEREARLEAARKEAEAALAAAAAEKQALEGRQAAFEAERRDLFRKAEEDARNRRQELLEQARADAGTERAKWERGLEEARKTAADAWAAAIRRQAFDLAETILREVADADLDTACIRVFLRKLETMPDEERASLAPGPGTERRILVKTAMPMGQEAGAALAAGLHRVLGTDAPVRFENDPGLWLGVEMNAGGRTIAWSLAEGLAELEARALAASEAAHGTG